MSNFIANKLIIFDEREPPNQKVDKITKIKFTKTQTIVKAIIIFSFTFVIFKISLTQKSIKVKGNITKICHVSYLIKVAILKNIGLF